MQFSNISFLGLNLNLAKFGSCLCQTNLNSLKMLQNAKFYLLKMKFASLVTYFYMYVVTISFLHDWNLKSAYSAFSVVQVNSSSLK